MPEPKRGYGYYVFPFLLDGELVARVDLKADRRGRRAAGAGRVRRARESDRARVAAELAAELREMADWLGARTMSWSRSGVISPRRWPRPSDPAVERGARPAGALDRTTA